MKKLTATELLKEVKVLDWLLIVLAIPLLFFKIDYGNLDTLDKVYLFSFGLWFVMLVIRLYFLRKGRRL